jgi:phosphoribosylanthranilate isomerase
MEALADRARGRAQIVILTVNATDAHLGALNEVVKPDWWQLHGSEDAARVEAVRTQFGRPVMKAVGIGSAEDVVSANAFVGVADQVAARCQAAQRCHAPGWPGCDI